MTRNVARLGDIATITSGFAFKSSHFNDSGEGLPLVRIRDVTIGSSETYYSGEFKDEFLVDDGDALIGMDGEFNIAKWRGGRALLNQRVCKVQASNSRIDQDYLIRFLPSALKVIEDRTPFVTVKHLSVKELREVEVPTPPITEQRRIAAILDKANALRAKRREAIAKLDQLLQSVFLDMFGDPATNPKNLPVKPLGELAAEIYRYPTYYDIEYQADGVPEVRGEMILGNGTIDPLKARYISQATSNLFPRTQLVEGDLVMSVRGTIGKIGFVAGDLEGANMTANLIRISPDKAQLNPSYLWRYAMSAFFADYVDRVSASTTIKTIKAPDLRALPVLVPTMAEQDKFADVQRRLLNTAGTALKGEQSLGKMFSSLQAKAFSGEV